ncbi:MAG: type II secretion system F family protein [Pirellulaceae bacterium]|nr:type II secretion system F family protein [Pirellulaceae bacterium]
MSDYSSIMESAAFLPSLLTALAVGMAVWTIASVFGKKVPLPPGASSFETERRAVLEELNPTYRYLQPIVLDVAKFNRMFSDESARSKIRKSMEIGGQVDPWEPEEFTATKQVEGFFAGIMVGAIALVAVPVAAAIVVGIFVGAMYSVMAVANMQEQAKSRLHIIKMRLPFAVDLMALMIEAGATFRDALETVVRENREHPLGEELARVNRQIELGRPRAAALRAFQDRFDDQDITEIVFAVNKGEELGTPLAEVLRNQADQMRLKRSQWGEKAAAEAQVKMSFPGMVVMIACMLVVLGPIVLPAVSAFLEQ